MYKFKINSLSPIHIAENKAAIIPPVIYSNKLYIIDSKLFYEVLSRINMLKEFIVESREKGYEYTVKWLQKKQLLNEGFLENTSKYWLDDVSIKRLNNYKEFYKNEHSLPIIKDQYIKKYLKNILFYDFISERKEEFSLFTIDSIKLVKSELETIKQENHYQKRRDYYQKMFFNILIERFLEKADQDFFKKLRIIDSLKFNIESQKLSDIGVYRIGNINNYKNNSFKTEKVTHRECLKRNSQITFSTKSSYFNLLDIYKVKDKSTSLVEEKLNFEKSYIKKLLADENKNTDQVCEKCSNKSKKEYCKLEKHHSKASNFSNLDTYSDTKYLNCYQDINTIGEDLYLNKFYSTVANANMLIDSCLEFSELLSLISLDKNLLGEINNLLYGRQNITESNTVKLTFINAKSAYMPFGYAELILD